MRIHSTPSQGLRAVCLLAGLAASGPVFAMIPASASNALDPPIPQRVAELATDIQGIDAGGTPIRLSRFRGKVILLDISKIGCTVCEVSASALQNLFEAYGPQGLAVVTCLAEDQHGAPVPQAGLQQWVATHGLTYPVMNDASGSRNGVAERAYTSVMGGFPTLALIDRAFKVQYLERGLDLTTLASRIKNLLAQ